MVGTLPEMVQTIVPKDFTQYCSSPPLCTMISYGYTLSLERIFCLIPYKDVAHGPIGTVYNDEISTCSLCTMCLLYSLPSVHLVISFVLTVLKFALSKFIV